MRLSCWLVDLSVSLFVHLSVSTFDCLVVGHLAVNVMTNRENKSVHLFVHLSVCLLFVQLFICMSTCLSITLFVNYKINR